MAVTTRLFLGSTAPTATSGVSITATIRGGAVRIAARPKRIPNAAGVAVRELDDGVSGVVGVRALDFVKDPPEPEAVLTFSD